MLHLGAHLSSLHGTTACSSWGNTMLPPGHQRMPVQGIFTLCPGHHSTHSGHHCAHCSAPLVGSVWGSTLCRPQGRTGCGVGLVRRPQHTAHEPILSRDKPSSWWGGTSGEPGLLIFKLIHLWGTPAGKLGRTVGPRGESGMLGYPVQAIYTAIYTTRAPRTPWATFLATIGKHGLQLPFIHRRLGR